MRGTFRSFRDVTQIAVYSVAANKIECRADSFDRWIFPPFEFSDLEYYRATERHAWAEYLTVFKGSPLFGDEKFHFVIRLSITPAFPASLFIHKVAANMKVMILGMLCILAYGCTLVPREEPMINNSADFYMYGGDIESTELNTIRSCQKIKEIASVHGAQMLIVEVSPGIATGAAFEGLVKKSSD